MAEEADGEEGRHERHLRSLFARFGDGERGVDREGALSLCDALGLPPRLTDRLLPAAGARHDFARFRADLLALLADDPALSERGDAGDRGGRGHLRRSVSYPDDGRGERGPPPRAHSSGPPDRPPPPQHSQQPFETDLLERIERAEAERDKARSDLADANRRAALLAQEVDESHAATEAAARAEVERAERRRAEDVRELQSRLDAEREAGARAQDRLERRLVRAEAEEGRLRARFAVEEENAERLRREGAELGERLGELASVNARLTEEVRRAAAERRDREADAAEAERRREADERAARLREENSRLRDRNDELCAELERRTAPPPANGVKRRGATPSPPRPEPSAEGESPRISKLRKFYDETLVGPDAASRPTSAERFFEDLMRVLTAARSDGALKYFEQVNCENFLKILHKSSYKYYYLLFYYLLCRIKGDIKHINTIDNENVGSRENCSHVNSKLQTLIEETGNLPPDDFLNLVNETDMSGHPFDEFEFDPLHKKSEVGMLSATVESLNKLLIVEKENAENERTKHSDKILELEEKIESLKSMYEECEDYWESKLKEERDIFDQEQQINEEKFTELMDKLAEYEEQFGFKDSKNDLPSRLPLSTIDEKCMLEKQFNDLEDEFQSYRTTTGAEINSKDAEISALKEKLVCLESSINSPNEQSTKEHSLEDKANSIDEPCDVLNENAPTITSPIEYLWNQKTISTPLANGKSSCEKVRDYQNPIFSKTGNKNIDSNLIKAPSKPDEADTINDSSSYCISPIQKPISAIAPPPQVLDSNIFSPKIDGKMLYCSDLEEALQGRRKDSPKSDINQNQINGDVKHASRVAYNQDNSSFQVALLDIRCRQLQTALRQQQIYTETLMQQTLANHRSEVGALRQKLAAADLLVRDLYVENCHLTGTIINAP